MGEGDGVAASVLVGGEWWGRALEWWRAASHNPRCPAQGSHTGPRQSVTTRSGEQGAPTEHQSVTTILLAAFYTTKTMFFSRARRRRVLKNHFFERHDPPAARSGRNHLVGT